MITFAKGHAYGNDFLYVQTADVAGLDLSRFAREICDRHHGVGADGLIVYDVTRDGRFLINTVLGDSAPAPITVLLNWQLPAR